MSPLRQKRTILNNDINTDNINAPVVGNPDFVAEGVFPAHHHPFHQLIYTVHGVVQMSTTQGRWILPPSRALWIPADVEHTLSAKRTAEVRILYIKRKAPAVPKWKDCTVMEVSPLVRELIIECANFPWDYPKSSKEARVAQVLLEQLASLPMSPVNLPMPKDSRALKVAQLVLEDPSNRSTLSELASKTGSTPRTIERIFKSETFMSFGAWRLRQRLMVALELLAEGDSVTNVALATGYESPSSFIASFRTMFGVTPARYFSQSK